MPHLNLDLDYFNHPKTSRLVGLLGKGAELLPIRLWCYCGKYHAEDGRMSGYSQQEVEAAAGWWGEPGKAVRAMLAVGFVEKSEDGYSVHDWTDCQGHIAAYKRKGREMAAARWKGHNKKERANAASNAASNAVEAAQQCQNQRIEPTKRKKDPPTPQGGEGTGVGVGFYKLIPESLRTEEFLSAWSAWLAHRVERKPRYTAVSAGRALPKLAAEGVSAAIDRIDRCIANGYQGLFFQGEHNGTNGHRRNKRDEQMSLIELAVEED